MDAILDIVPFAWPLVVVLVLLIVLRKIESTVNPVIVSVVSGLAKQASSNALAYGLAIGYGLSASLQALAEQAVLLNWPYVAAFARVFNPFVVAMLAFAANGNIQPTAPKQP